MRARNFEKIAIAIERGASRCALFQLRDVTVSKIFKCTIRDVIGRRVMDAVQNNFKTMIRIKTKLTEDKWRLSKNSD